MILKELPVQPFYRAFLNLHGSGVLKPLSGCYMVYHFEALSSERYPLQAIRALYIIEKEQIKDSKEKRPESDNNNETKRRTRESNNKYLQMFF